MKYTKAFLLFVFAGTLIAGPGLAGATTTPATATSSPSWWRSQGSDDTGSVRRDRIRGYRQRSSETQQKINALPSTANTVVLMPILFGVGVKDLFPNFGDPRDGGARTHEGEDIMAVKGTPIVSPTPAVVLKVVTGAGEGNAVYTANPGGETFVYMHLDRFGEGVSEGTVLAQGSLIGYVGNTGNASGGPAHLHFEIHTSGNAVDPFPRLTGEFSLQEKISDLSTILTQTSDSTALAQFLVLNFRSTFSNALSANIALPWQIVSALGALPATPVPAGKVVGLTRNLYKGIVGEDVRALQKLLNANGYVVAQIGAGSVGNETTYFGPATHAAVMKFQTDRGISPIAGYVGPITRAALATLTATASLLYSTYDYA